jgi:hypothetical protein
VPSAVHWHRNVPEAVRALDTMVAPDYCDIVTATVEELPQRTPEEWLLVSLKGVPRGLLMFVPLIQRLVLGLRLQMRPSPDHVLGWKIADRGDDWLRIEAASWFMTGHVVMHVNEGQMHFATFISCDRWPAAFIWPPVSLIHRQVALALVRSAVRAR